MPWFTELCYTNKGFSCPATLFLQLSLSRKVQTSKMFFATHSFFDCIVLEIGLAFKHSQKKKLYHFLGKKSTKRRVNSIFHRAELKNQFYNPKYSKYYFEQWSVVEQRTLVFIHIDLAQLFLLYMHSNCHELSQLCWLTIPKNFEERIWKEKSYDIFWSKKIEELFYLNDD